MRRTPPLVAAMFVVVAISGEAHAEPKLRVDPVADGVVTGSLAALWIGSEIAKGPLGPASCRVCDAPPFDKSARGALVWSDPKPAHVASNILLYGALPLGLASLSLASHWGKGDRWTETGIDLLLIAEATAITAGVNQLVKFAVGRERPFVHQLSGDAKANTESPSDNNLSFFSGHTSVTFAMAVSAGTLSSMRRSPFAPAVWGTGLLLATTTGYLRIAADKHWMSDVVVGALVGSAIGFAIPYFLHRPRSEASQPSTAFTVSPTTNGVSVGGIF